MPTCGVNARPLELPEVRAAKVQLLSFRHLRGAALKGVHACGGGWAGSWVEPVVGRVPKLWCSS